MPEIQPGEEARRQFLFLLGGARADGNTEILARQAALQLPADVGQDTRALAKAKSLFSADGA